VTPNRAERLLDRRGTNMPLLKKMIYELGEESLRNRVALSVHGI
jgi:hypothetical protein